MDTNNNNNLKYITFHEIMKKTGLSYTTIFQRVKRENIVMYSTGDRNSKKILLSDYNMISRKLYQRARPSGLKENEITIPEFLNKHNIFPSRVYSFISMHVDELEKYGLRKDKVTNKVIITNEVKFALEIKAGGIINKWRRRLENLKSEIKSFNSRLEFDIKAQNESASFNKAVREKIYSNSAEDLLFNISNIILGEENEHDTKPTST